MKEEVRKKFLWDGGVEQRRVPPIAWEKVCRPKREGGLGLRDGIRWNNAAIGKLVWWLVIKADSLWIKWVNHVYMKGKDVLEYEGRVDDCWYWKKLIKVRDLLRPGLESGLWLDGQATYSVKRVYNWLSPARETVSWYKKVWCAKGIPKHQFLAWMAQHQGLKVKTRLYQYGAVQDPFCCLCGCQFEDLTHLFQQCVFVIQVWQGVAGWIGFPYVEGSNVWDLGIPRRWPKLKRRLVNLAYMAVLYSVWEQRNKAWAEHMVERPSVVVRKLVLRLKAVVNVEASNSWSIVDKEWWNRLM